MTDRSGSDGSAGPRQWAALAVLVIPVMVLSIDLMVLGFAVPALSEALAPTGTELLWIVDVYGFFLAGLLVSMGNLGDRIGRRRLLMSGATGFAAASLLAALAPDTATLIAARALMGLAGATLMPSTLSMIRTVFPEPAQRRRAIAIWAAAFAGGAGLGPLVGGALLQNFWWGSVFLINVPIMLVVVAAARLLVPESRNPGPGPFDPLSAALSIATILPVVYGIKHIAEIRAVDLTAAAAIAAGLGVGWWFVRRQRRLPYPLLDVGLFADRAFTTAVVTNVFGVFALVGAMFFLPQYLQLVQGNGPLRSGLWILPAALGAIIGALSASLLVRRLSVRLVVGTGLLLAAAGFGVCALLEQDSTLWLVAAGGALIGFGIGAAESLTNDLIIAAAPPDRAGAAAAVSETAYELGAALGTAILGSIGILLYRHHLDDTAAATLPAEVFAAARETLGAATHAGATLPAEAGARLLDSARHAFTDAMTTTFLVAALVVGAGGLHALRRLGTRAANASAAPPPASARL